MSPSRPFILRPVATALLMVAVFLAGGVAYFQLPVSALPEVDYPTIEVQTFYPGASPEVVASAVTAPLERQFGEVAGLSQMTSTSSGGSSIIVMQFQLSLDIDVAEQEVQAAINAAQSYLPANLPAPPVYSKSNPADAPVLTLALTSDTMPLSEVEDLADTRLSPKISQITGVGLVSISGGQKPAVRIQANPTALAAYGINLEDLRNALTANSLDSAKGNFDGPAQDYTINANDQLQSSADYKSVVVAYRNGAPVMLTEVARVVDGVENKALAAWVNTTPAVVLNIQRQPGANTIQVVDSIEHLLPQLESTLPAAVHVQIVTDRTIDIRASVKDVEFELLLVIALVVMVIFLFLRSLSATIIPSIAVPLSLVGTFGVMYLAGYSLNNLTMMALTISTGFVVDDAIVMIENISRYIEEGDEPMEAALKGAEQIGFTILSLTVSLIAVLIPLLFMGDVAGRLFRQFAVTLAVTIVFSAFVSLTLTPMMSARLLSYTPPEKQGWFYKKSEHVFESIIAFYGRTLRWVLQYQTITLLIALATLVLTVVMYMTIPKGFFPTQDTGIIQGITQASPSISFAEMEQKQQQMAEVLLKDSAVSGISSFIGADGTNTTLNSGRIEINLKPLEDRGISATQVIARLQSEIAQIPGITLYMQPVQDLTVDDRVSRTEYQYTLEDPNQTELNSVTHDLVAKLKKLPQLADVVTDQQLGGQAEDLVIDRPTASRFGVTPSTIDNTLYDAFGQRQINTMYTQLNQYHVILETDPKFQLNPDKLNDIYVQASTSGTVAAPVASVAGSSSGAGSGATASSGNALLTATSTNGVSSAATSTAALSSGNNSVSLATSTVNPTSALSPSSNTGTTATVISTASTTTGSSSSANTSVSGTTRPSTSSSSTGGSSSGGGSAGSSNSSSAALPTPVPLSAFTRFETGSEALSINHQGQFPSVTVSFNLADGSSLGQALDAINKVVANANMPASVISNYQGTAAAFEGSLSNEGLLILAALVTVYIVLGVLYESFVHPVTILSTLPSAGVGALLALELFHLDLDIVAIIGIILLIGIVKKNGIMMVDFALEAERKHGMNATEAIYQASLLRFRPILMTTMAALLSGIPLAFGTGIGSELRKPLGVSMVGGLLFSQVLTLYTTPVIYIFFDNLGARFGHRRPSKTTIAQPEAGRRMNPSRVFIERPVATTLLTAAVAMAGIIAFLVLPVSPLPQVDFPTITVAASLPGASPDIMASSIATPLERQFGHIAGVTEMTSSSTLGTTSVTLQFELNRDINGAARDVEAGINAARTYLPSNLPANPSYRKVNPADSPIMVLGLQSDIYSIPEIYDEASTVIEQRISQISGVGEVLAVGASLPAVRIELNPDQLNSYGISLPAVQQVVSGQNSNLAKGQLSGVNTTADIVANDQISKAAAYQPLIVGYHNGGAVRLEDVADVVDSQQTIRQAGFLNGKLSVNLIIFRQPGANIITTVDAIKAALPSLQAQIPRGEHLITVLDRTLTIRASVKDIELTLIISVMLVVLVVFLFLRELPATLVPAVAVPVSLIGTCAVMYLCGFTLDNLSLMALAIASGFVVDDAIVVMENISRHVEEGLSPVQASLKGAQEIGFTVFSISVSLIAVFIPLLLMGGIIGRLFREFSITLSAAILVSMVISLTTTPMMCSRVLKSEASKKHGRIYQWSERGFNRVLRGYRDSLNWVLDHPALILLVFVGTLVLNVFLIVRIPKGFFPQQDTGVMSGGMQGPQDTSFYAMRTAVQQAVRIIKADPGVENIMAFTGGQGSTNNGFTFIALKPLNERAGVATIINRLRPKLATVPGAATFLQAVQDIRIGGRQANAEYQYTLSAETTADLQKYGPQLLSALKKAPGFEDANTDQQNDGLQALLTYDRPTAARLGVTPQIIDNTLYDAFGQSEASVIDTELNQYYVVLEVAPKYWQTPGGLKHTYLIPNSGGGAIPLDSVLHYVPSTSPLAVNHTGLFPSVTVNFNLAPGVSLGQATKEIDQIQQSLGVPQSMHGMFAGTLQAFQASLGTEPYLILTAIAAVYIVLGMLYESLIHPITILSTLPPASVGAMLALLLTKSELDVMSIIGIILLIGIVKKNAIMMIDFALNAERNEGKNTRDSIFEASMLRFRPILMTTMAALFGAVPLAVGTGMGSELRRPLGISIIGGLLVSQVLTLYTTPVIYLFMDNLRLKLQGDKRARLFTSTVAAH